MFAPAVLVAMLAGPAPSGLASPAPARPHVDLIVGYEADAPHVGFGHVGLVATHPLGGPLALSLHASGASIRYTYIANDSAFRASALPAVRLLAGPVLTVGRAEFALRGGYEVRRTRLTIPPATVRRTRTDDGLLLESSADWWSRARTNYNLLASYSARDRFVWARGRIKQQVTNREFARPTSLFLGVEAVDSGNRDFHAWQIGGVFSAYRAPERLNLDLRIGARHTTVPSTSSLFAGADVFVRL